MPSHRVSPAQAPGRQDPRAGWGGTRHVIPYDHGATFDLRGEPGRLVQDVINIGPDGVFVATGIGYGFEEDRARDLPLPAVRDAGEPGDITLGQIPLDALVEGVRVSPRLDALVFDTPGPAARFSNQPLPAQQRATLLQRVRPPRSDLSFLFSLADSASGREMQDEAALNLASLGSAAGERPFRPLAQPVQFLPRSTVRLQVEERSFDRRGTLFIVLYGYKVLASSVCPEPLQPAARALFTPPRIEQAVPFDYVATVELSGVPGRRVETEVPISAEGGFVATAIGYGLAGEDLQLPIDWVQQGQPASSPLSLADLRLRSLGVTALRDGFRLRPEFVSLAHDGNGGLATLPGAVAERMFESLNRPEDVSFRYALHDTGVGTELQNQALHNVAGLGIANGDRPFKRFTPPMQMFARSALRLTVQEHSGRGRLYFALHGFKRLDALAGRP